VFFLILFFISIHRGDEMRKKLQEPAVIFNPKHYICYKVEKPIEVDGNIEKEQWQKAEWTDYFVDIEGDIQPKPYYKTRVKMLWDDSYLYFAAELEEEHIWATLTERESIIFHDNDFEIFIDPDGDTHNYYEFEVNAFGTIWDLMLIKPYRDGGPYVVGWDIRGIKVGVSIDGTINNPKDKDRRWTVEVAMPWEILKECAPGREVPKAYDQWRINFSRVEWDVDIIDGKYVKRKDPKTGKNFPEHNWVWSPQGLINMHYPEMWGFVQFSDKIVGTGKDEFVMNKEEYVKFALRKLYYRQWNYFVRFGKFSNNLEDLYKNDIKELDFIPEYKFDPIIETTSSLFEIKAKSFNGNFIWHIMNDGKVWKSK